MLNDLLPAPGRLLISEPFLPDPNFKRSVVLLAEHEEQGSLGFVLNNKSNVQLRDVVPELEKAEFPIYFGGPVATDSLFFLHRCYDRMLSGEEISEGIYWGGNFETLKILITNNAVAEEEIRFVVGYSGWDEGQLMQEINQNSWIVSEQFSADQLFSENEEDIWKTILAGMGNRFAHLGNFPADPSLN